MKRYEYQKIRVKVKNGFIENKFSEDYFDIIQREGAQGWRLNQMFAPSVGVYGVACWVDLIFEREV